MSELPDFLLARIAEDEEGARAAATYSAEWSTTDEFQETVLLDPDDSYGHTFDSVFGQIAPHIARHDPKRVLAECAAKRRIIALAEEVSAEWATEFIGPDILRALALPYADHPDYRPEWRL